TRPTSVRVRGTDDAATVPVTRVVLGQTVHHPRCCLLHRLTDRRIARPCGDGGGDQPRAGSGGCGRAGGLATDSRAGLRGGSHRSAVLPTAGRIGISTSGAPPALHALSPSAPPRRAGRLSRP